MPSFFSFPVPVVVASLLLAPWSGAFAQACSKHKQSPAYTVALLELYTSEGCSSCPPADRFVSGLRNGRLAAQAVPLSLHVDYWDYIGWQDRFARPAFSVRQRWLANLASSRTIYTPEIFVAGRELRGWHDGLAATVAQINRRPARADISITQGKRMGDGLPLEVRARAPQGGKLFVALYENGISSEIRAGENHGAVLRHDFVVRDWIGPLAVAGDGGNVVLPRALTVPSGASSGNLGIAAFVQNEQGEVLQALALPVCGA